MKLLLSILFFLIAGCAGGGGSIHNPPKEVKFNKPTDLEIILSTWGAGWGDIEGRYTEINCHYKTDIETEYKKIMPIDKYVKNEKLIVLFELPSIKNKTATEVMYYFDMKFDGVYNKREITVLKISGT